MRPVHELITLNFTRLEKVQNKSNRYFWKCNHCGDADGSRGAQIQGRDNNLANHLKECLKAPQEARKDARVFLSNKVQTEGSGPSDVLPSMNSSGTSSSSQAVTESGRSGNLAVTAVSGVKKRKSNSLIGYVDVAMTKEQAARANSKLIRFFIHANIPFSVAGDEYFHEFLNEIRPSYEAPSRYVLSHNLLDSEAARVELEEIDRLKARKCLTLLLDGGA
ncbi:hypothetical protein AX14_009283 [Amanita brunnescens Koide BX004]|nr:hypothetical protein AX14_009283 [Amanita brunnescens Koide BX004]